MATFEQVYASLPTEPQAKRAEFERLAFRRSRADPPGDLPTLHAKASIEQTDGYRLIDRRSEWN